MPATASRSTAKTKAKPAKKPADKAAEFVSQMAMNGFPVERRKVAELQKAPYNPRKITEHDAASLRRSVEAFGMLQPIIVNRRTGNVVGGHQRIDALLSLGEEYTDVLVIDKSATVEKAANIAMNRIHGDWENRKLATLLGELATTDLDMALTGFTESELLQVGLSVETTGNTDPNELPPERPTRTKRGELWGMGSHRLICGDCTNAEDVERLFAGILKADILLTDPPYGVDYTAKDNEIRKATGHQQRQPHRLSRLLRRVSQFGAVGRIQHRLHFHGREGTPQPATRARRR